MRSCAVFAFVLTMVAVLGSLVPAPAEAQLSPGNLRLSVDADMFSVAKVEVGAGPEAVVVGLGPNQLGASRVTGGPTPLGLGVGYVLQHNLILGLRFGLGYDVYAPDGPGSNVRYLGLSLMPGVTFVPYGERTKLFITAAPIFQVSRARTDLTRSRTLLGGIGLGIGAFIFVTNSVSVDLGVHFEGRFGNTRDNNDNDNNDDDGRSRAVTDLRGIFRIGVSLWT